MSPEAVPPVVIDPLTAPVASGPLAALAQSQGEVGTGLFWSAVGAFLGTLIVGAS